MAWTSLLVNPLSSGVSFLMTAIEQSERLIETVKANRHISNYGNGCNDSLLVCAEAELGLSFPPSYRRIVAEFGTWDVAGREFLGVYQTEALGSTILGSSLETLERREDIGLPVELIVVMLDDAGGIVALDSSRVDSDGENPVVAWNPGITDLSQAEALGGNFGTFSLGLVRRAVQDWRASR